MNNEGEDGVHKGTEGGTGSGYAGLGKKNAELTLGDVMRKPKELDPGFKELRCLQGEGKKGGRCVHIEDWDGRAIPDLRPNAAPGAWIAVVGQHMIRRRVEGKVKTLHNGGLSPWKGDAATGRSLKGAKGVNFLTERQARAIVKTHSSLYKEWLKNNPKN